MAGMTLGAKIIEAGASGKLDRWGWKEKFKVMFTSILRSINHTRDLNLSLFQPLDTSYAVYAQRCITMQRLLGAFAVLLLFNVSSLYASGQSAAPKASQIEKQLELVQEALKANNPEAAMTGLSAVLALDPQNVEARANLGVLEFFTRGCQAASQDLSQALAIQPDLPKVEALMGICESRSGNSNAQTLLASSFKELKDEKLRIEVGVELANLYYLQGDLGRASSTVQSMLEIEPNNADVLYLAQRIYYEMADDSINRLALAAPDSARMQQAIAERLINLGNLQGAMTHFRKALAIAPQLSTLHFELGEALLQGSPADSSVQADAEKEIEAAMKLGGDTPSIECELGGIAFFRNDLKQAYAHYEHALTMDPHNGEAESGLGQVLMREEKPEEAAKFLRAAVAANSFSLKDRYQLAIAYRDLQLTAQSKKEFQTYQDIRRAKEQSEKLLDQIGMQKTSSGVELVGTPK
jgi:Flp pilus assembly protein TadD